MIQRNTMQPNQYEGVNCHLNDYLVTTSNGWEGFHMSMIVQLQSDLNTWIAEQGIPYRADFRAGLQIRPIDPDSGNPTGRPWMPEPDVAIYRLQNQGDSITSPERGSSKSNVLEMDVNEALAVAPQTFSAIGISKVEKRTGVLGEPVVWIEILSPTNKPKPRQGTSLTRNWGRDAEGYADKRRRLVQEGNQILVEIDLLQGQPSFLRSIPQYIPDNPEPGAKAYSVTVIDPHSRPDHPDGVAHVYPFGVEESLPHQAVIPLADNDALVVDFDRTYDRAFENTYGTLPIDYSKHPALWGNDISFYTQEDKKRIAARMVTVLQGQRAGLVGAEQEEPLPLAVSVDEALASLEGEQQMGDEGPSFDIL